MITFAADNDLFRKRKRVYRACADCKKRRKRCTHTFTENGPPVKKRSTGDALDSQITGSERKATGGSSGSTLENHTLRSNGGLHADQPRLATPIGHDEYLLRSNSPSRFIGDLQPEAIFLRERGKIPVGNECGHWNKPPRRASALPDDDDAETQHVELSTMGDLTPTEKEALDAYLSAFNVNLLPPAEHLDALLSIYFSSIHPILPIVDKTELTDRNSTDGPSILLQQSICLIAAKHSKARPHLTFNDSVILTPRDFAKRLYKSITTALGVNMEISKVLLIQVLALLSMHAEGPAGNEQASLHLAQAIHHAHTLGMQFGRARSDDRAEYATQLFWCLWSLDKLSGATSGRPLLIHDQDNNLEYPVGKPELKRTPFGIWLQLAGALDHVITFYRPRSDPTATGWEEGFPNFEDLLDEEGNALDAPTLAVLELFHHCVAMWAYRARSINDPIPSTPSYVRQSLASVRTISILTKECPENLPPLPVVPYAVSLSTAVSYRAFRQTKLASHRKRSKEDLEACCKILEKMRDSWWSAGAMADLGTAALKNAEGPTRRGSAATHALPQNPTPHVNGHHRESQTPGVMSNSTPAASGSQPTTTTDDTNMPTSAFVHETSLPTMDPNGVQLDPQPFAGFELMPSQDWLNFDNAFENMDTLLGSSGADMSMELLRPFSYDPWAFQPASG